MTVMFEDIHRTVNRKLYSKSLKKGPVDGLSFTEILYADDTLLILKDSDSATTLLQAIEEESKYYNMKIKEDKCETIAMDGKSKVKVKSGKTMKEVEQATYLGGTLHKNIKPKTEIRKRISATIPIVRKLELFWKQAE